MPKDRAYIETAENHLRIMSRSGEMLGAYSTESGIAKIDQAITRLLLIDFIQPYEAQGMRRDIRGPTRARQEAKITSQNLVKAGMLSIKMKDTMRAIREISEVSRLVREIYLPVILSE